jgi:hypothetical protein
MCEVFVVNNVPPFHESCLIRPNDSKEVKLELAHQYFSKNLVHAIKHHDGVPISNCEWSSFFGMRMISSLLKSRGISLASKMLLKVSKMVGDVS